MKTFFKYAIVAVLSSISTLVIIYAALVLAFGWSTTDFNNIFRLSMAYEAASHAFVHEIDKEKITEAGMKGIMNSLDDKFSLYMDSKYYQSLKDQTNGNFTGIGVVVGETTHHEVLILKVMENAPAEKSGLKAGDIITAVDGKSIAGLSLEKATDLIRGPVDTKVTLKIKRGNEVKDFDVTREVVTYKTVYSKMLKDHMGLIIITMFSQNTADEFHKQLEALKAQGMKGLIIDLRDNPGGLLQSVTKVGNDVLPAGNMVSIIYRNGKRDDYVVDKRNLDVPMVVLINKNSASAAEILAGALQDTKTATVVGEKSYGKGSVQTIWPLTNGDGIKVTIAKYYTPSMKTIDKVGIIPDVEVHLDHSKQDTQLKKAEAILAEKIK